MKQTVTLNAFCDMCNEDILTGWLELTLDNLRMELCWKCGKHLQQELVHRSRTGRELVENMAAGKEGEHDVE